MLTDARNPQQQPLAERAVLLGVTAFGLLATTLVALRPVHVTAGWTDQSHYHMPTIVDMASRLPAVDITNVKTATGPLYHLSLAIPARVLGLPDAAIQIVGGTLYLALLAAAIIWATRGLPTVPRLLLGAAVIASPYVWESTLWAATDTAALALGMFAVTLLARFDRAPRELVLAGVAVAAAIATRQTFAWLLLPAFVAGMAPADPRVRLRNVGILCGPGACALIALVATWGGLTPPQFTDINGAGPSPVGLTYGLALWAFFACPILCVTRTRSYPRRTVIAAAIVGVAATVPAIVWRSDFNDHNSVRMGGWLWLLVKAAGDVAQRSPLLIALGFVGGAALVLIFAEVQAARGRGMATFVSVAVVAAILSASASTQAFQKYYEIPLLICYTVTVVALWSGRAGKLRPAPITVPAALQMLSLAATVGVPVVAVLW